MVTPHRPQPRDAHPVASELSEPHMSGFPPNDAVSSPPEFSSPAVDVHAMEVRSLQPFGLSSREARLYLALLKTGPVGAGEASRLSGLHRATGYRVLARLLARGLAKGDGRWPQLFHAESAQVLGDRIGLFLRDEIELRHWAAGVYPSAPASPDASMRDGRLERRAALPGVATDSVATSRLRMVSWGTATTSVPLALLRKAKRGIDACLRPGTISPGVRNAVGATLAKASSQGVVVRLVLDYAVADHRFVDRVRRDPRNRLLSFDVRHFTPLAGHLYIVDGRLALRFPTLSCLARGTDIGLTSEDPEFVRAQVARFESIWSDATAAVGALSSTRSFSWRDPREIAETPRAPAGPIGSANGTGSLFGDRRHAPP